MGILDKLFGGDKKAEKTASDFLKKLADLAGTEKKPQQTSQKPSEPVRQSRPEKPAEPEDLGPWETVPEEECQYNFKGSYIEYFEHVFREDFPEYRAEYERPDGRRTVFTLYRGGAKALIVELLTEKSAVKKLRTQCRNEGIPYVRFYYDHEGWWNTRTYVKERVKAALKI